MQNSQMLSILFSKIGLPESAMLTLEKVNVFQMFINPQGSRAIKT